MGGAMFNMIGPYFYDGGRVLILYAGKRWTLYREAVSRGMSEGRSSGKEIVEAQEGVTVLP